MTWHVACSSREQERPPMRRDSRLSMRFFLGHLFGLMAFSGLLLAWYGVWVAPVEPIGSQYQEVRSVQELTFKTGSASTLLNR